MAAEAAPAAAAAAAAAPPFVDLSGTWLVDKAKSESIAPFLAEVGVPRLVRGLAAKSSPTTVLVHETETLHVVQKTFFKNTGNTYRFGEEVDVTVPSGDVSKQTARVLESGEIQIVGAAVGALLKRGWHQTRTTHTLQDGGDELVVVMELLRPGGEVGLRIRRVLKRKAA